MPVSNSSLFASLASAFVLGAAAPALSQHMGPDADPAAQLAASGAEQARTGAFTGVLISQRFSPVANAFALPGAPGTVGAQGLAGGDTPMLKDWSIWSSVVGRQTENDFAPEEQDSDIWTLSMGADRPVGESTTVGVSLTLTREEADTAFGTGNRNADSIFIAPYANFKLNDWLSADVSLGYGHTDTNQMRSVFGAPVTGSHDSQTVFGAANLTAAKWHGSTLMSGVIGLSGSSTRRDGFTESDGTVNPSDTSELLQARLGGTVGYYTAPMLPYLSAEYIYDLDYERSAVAGAPNDRDEFRVTLGSHIYGTGRNQNLSGGFAVSHQLGRDSKDDTSVNLSFRLAF